MKYHAVVMGRDGNEIKSWGVFPIGATKILDGIYNPESKSLSLLFDSVTNGPKEVKVSKDRGKEEVQIRNVDEYYRFHLLEQDIPFFLETYVENNFEFTPDEPKKLIISEQVD